MSALFFPQQLWNNCNFQGHARTQYLPCSIFISFYLTLIIPSPGNKMKSEGLTLSVERFSSLMTLDARGSASCCLSWPAYHRMLAGGSADTTHVRFTSPVM